MSRERRQMPGTLNPLTKRGKRPPGAIVITHNHVSATQCAHTHTRTGHTHTVMCSFSRRADLHTHTHCQEGPLGPVIASRRLIRLAGLDESCCCRCCCCRRGREMYHGSGEGRKRRTLSRMEPSNRLHLFFFPLSPFSLSPPHLENFGSSETRRSQLTQFTG